MSLFDKKPKTPETFAEALLGDLDLSHLSGTISTSTPENLTEKAVLLESFTQFAEEQLSESPEGVMSFPGGELALKPTTKEGPFKPRFTSLGDWSSSQEVRLGQATWSALRADKEQVSVLFIGEALLGNEALETEIKTIRPEFLLSFSPPVADLFQKMVQAMKLSVSEYALTALQDVHGERETKDLLEEIHWLRPRYVVPLGARATQSLLGARERLASVHGKFFPLTQMEGSEIQVVPLFHPSVIASNINMKKSTWADMQKIMQALGKV
ncbi:MAG: uracil-DNA glycosylase family protein [Bacteriovoracia bacterium]